MKLKLTVLGEPLGKQRARATVRAGHAAVYTPTSQTEWEQMLAQMARRECEAQGYSVPFEGPMRLFVDAVRARPKRLQRRKDPEGIMWREDKPDADNVLKSVADGLEKGGLFVSSDAQISFASCRSLYAEKRGHSRTEIWLTYLEGEP